MKYVALLGISGLARVRGAVAPYGVVDAVTTASALLELLPRADCACVVLDPALISVADAEALAISAVRYLRPIVAFSSITTAALETGVILAQLTDAQFVFHGAVNERTALARTLLLAPNSALGTAVVGRLDTQLERLPTFLRDHIAKMLRVGDGPPTPDSLAAVSRIPRRSLDRRLGEAGFVSARLLIAAARLTGSYRAITSSRMPFKRIAGMLGYRSQRTMDGQVIALVGQNCASLRSDQPSTDLIASRIARVLTLRSAENPRDLTSWNGGKRDEPAAGQPISVDHSVRGASAVSRAGQPIALRAGYLSFEAGSTEAAKPQAPLP